MERSKKILDDIDNYHELLKVEKEQFVENRRLSETVFFVELRYIAISR